MELKLSTLEFGEEREHRKAIIAAVDDTFTDVGRRLGIIHDKKLYREHGSFEEYCLKFFKISKVHAYRLMEIAGVRAGITKKSNTRVTSNRALTALAAVPEADRDAVVTEAAKSGPVTAPAIKAAAEKIATPPKAREEKPAEGKDEGQEASHARLQNLEAIRLRQWQFSGLWLKNRSSDGFFG